MFWPDDNMWYLIEIHRVNVIDKTATIVYRWVHDTAQDSTAHSAAQHSPAQATIVYRSAVTGRRQHSARQQGTAQHITAARQQPYSTAPAPQVSARQHSTTQRSTSHHSARQQPSSTGGHMSAPRKTAQHSTAACTCRSSRSSSAANALAVHLTCTELGALLMHTHIEHITGMTGSLFTPDTPVAPWLRCWHLLRLAPAPRPTACCRVEELNLQLLESQPITCADAYQLIHWCACPVPSALQDG
jgi:hypothetical protein